MVSQTNFSQITLNQIKKAEQRFLTGYNSVVNSWPNHCDCEQPGGQVGCLQCPYFRELLNQLQQEVDPSKEMGLASVLSPELSPPYSDEIKQQSISMFIRGYSLQEIKKLTGVNSVVILRKWLEIEGIYQKESEYSEEQQQQCLNLYLQGKTPLEIEEVTRIPGKVIRNWVYHGGIARSKDNYSYEQKKLALSMYAAGESYSKIQNRTGIYNQKVKELALEANVSRKKKPKKGGRPPVYSDEFKQNCLDLLSQGKTPGQIEELMGVTAGTVRLWQKEDIAGQEDNS